MLLQLQLFYATLYHPIIHIIVSPQWGMYVQELCMVLVNMNNKAISPAQCQVEVVAGELASIQLLVKELL